MRCLYYGDGIISYYPLVNIQKNYGNHNVLLDISLFLWPFSIAMLNYQRVGHIRGMGLE